MKTFAALLAALLLASPAAYASKKVSSARPQQLDKKSSKKAPKKVSSAKPRKISSARPRQLPQRKNGLVLNYDIAGRPFYGTHRVLSLN